jgi:hypothetical protein
VPVAPERGQLGGDVAVRERRRGVDGVAVAVVQEQEEASVRLDGRR